MRGLALDGGGVMGAPQAQILAEAKKPHKFDFVTGTSIGAVISCYVAQKSDMSVALDFFHEYAPKIFAGRWWRKLKPFGPRYNDKELNKALQATLPGKFGDLKIPTFITAADLNRRRLKVFSSVDPDDGLWPTWEIARCAVAAESYFPPWKGFADGGIIANNPSMVGITGACRELGSKVSQIDLFSIGTGQKTVNDPVGSTSRWTKIQWGLWILKALTGGFTVTMHEAFASSLPLKKYHREQFHEPSGWDMDDPAVVDTCLELWAPDIKAAVKALNKF